MAKILLVEDNELNRDMLNRRLQRRGYEVVLAVDGAEAVLMATSARPDLILMDMSLPVMDGWEATRTIKADKNTSAIPVIALTAHAMVGDRERALASGCDDYDTKPVEIRHLLHKIETLLASHSPANTSAKTEVSKAQIEQPIIPEVLHQQTLSAIKKATSPIQIKQLQQGASAELLTGKLLVVDDNEENRDMLSRRLERKGYSVIVADSGEAALEIVQQDNINLVLLDVMMPGISGFETLKRIRQTHSPSRLPVVMVTARNREDDTVQAFALGANDYITKPIDFAIAIARIQAQLATLQAARQHVAEATQRQASAMATLRATQEQASATAFVRSPSVALAGRSQAADISVGDSLEERYQVTHILTEEFFSQTLVVRDLQQPGQSLYLLKRLQLRTEQQSLFDLASQSFTSEARTFRAISQHAQISTLLNYFTKEQNFYLVQEFVDGSLLANRLARNGPLKLLDVLKLTKDVLSILACFHKKQLIHSDIHPSNLLYRKHDGELILTDCGITKRLLIQLGQYSSQHRELLSKQQEYTPLEHHRDQPAFSSDIYAVGMIALHSLTGRRPQELVNPTTGELKWRNYVQVREGVAKFLDKLVCRDRQERYSSIQLALEHVNFHIKLLSILV